MKRSHRAIAIGMAGAAAGALTLMGCTVWPSPAPMDSAPMDSGESRAIASPAAPSRPSEPSIVNQRYDLPHSQVHVLRIPTSRYQVRTALSEGLDTVEVFARQSGAIAVLNGGFFDPVNQETTSYVTVQGVLRADPNQNERLIGNPNLATYLPQILNRSEFRRYSCGSETRYDIVFHDTPIPPNCELLDALGGGPRLLPDLTAAAEGFVETQNGILVRDAIGSVQRNARTAVGLTPEGDIVWVMAAQQPTGDAPSGLTLAELADFMQDLGVERALNLDGGSSSSLYYNGRLISGRYQDGQPVQRPVKSVLLIPVN